MNRNKRTRPKTTKRPRGKLKDVLIDQIRAVPDAMGAGGDAAAFFDGLHYHLHAGYSEFVAAMGRGDRTMPVRIQIGLATDAKLAAKKRRQVPETEADPHKSPRKTYNQVPETEGGRVRERAFRRGFYLGVDSTIDAIRAGATDADLCRWLDEQLMAWWMRCATKRELPPTVKISNRRKGRR